MNRYGWLLGSCVLAATTQANAAETYTMDEVLVTAEEILKQAPGVSIISAEDLAKQPVSNDLSEIIRTMPGVNLTGNSTSGQRGNNRQIDIRGMGPENTLILIDGKPVNSRKAVRYGWRGERDTRGDTNWVPAESVERIEVLRGPAAARYGNGAAGGVVNIITKAIPDQFSGSATVYTDQPEASKDGATKRTDFSLAGPLSDKVGLRISGNIAKTDSDSWVINEGHESTRTGKFVGTFPAGREGVRNKDLALRLSMQPVEAHRFDIDTSFSRQGNNYAGDTQNTNTNDLVQGKKGAETNIIYRNSYALTHKGEFDAGSSLTYVQYENTRNHRLDEGLAGGTEGIFEPPKDSMGKPIPNQYTMSTSVLDQLTVHSEFNMPTQLAGLDQVVTIGGEWTQSKFKDNNSTDQDTTEGGAVPGITDKDRNPKAQDHITSVFVEDNINLNDSTILTPGLRYDKHSVTGAKWSPALNITHYLDDAWTVKAGIASAYKAPNLYQTNPNYLLYSRGNGCSGAGGACYLQGNENLEAETSTNTELGIEYATNDIVAGVTYFHNDYRNKVEAGLQPIGKAIGGREADIFRWENVPKAIIEGLEGTFNIALTPDLVWSNNMTYMLQSKNKTTGESLSIIPEYTLNSRIDWQANDQLSLNTHVTWYGKQVPNELDFQGNKMEGEEQTQLSPYALFGLGGRYQLNDALSFNAGIKNLFDKRLYRKGNAVGVNDTDGSRTIYGAGAATYNEPGRSYFASATYSF